MKKYVCLVCGLVYDPELGCEVNGIEPGTDFEEVIENVDYMCPVCGAESDAFEPCDNKEDGVWIANAK